MNESVAIQSSNTVRNLLSEYRWPIKPGYEPFDVQKKTVKLMVNNRRGYVLNDIGTGKTLCALWAYDYLRSIGAATRMLVIAPLSTLEDRWVTELMEHFPHLRFKILHHPTKKKRLERLSKLVNVYIINHHGLYVILDELKARRDIDVVTVDELSAYRNPKSERLTVTLRNYVQMRRYVWGLTGSPCPRAVTDVWGPASCLTPWSIPKYFSWFKADLMFNIGNFRWIPKPGAEEKAIQCLQPSVRYKLKDIIELPSRVTNYYKASLTPKQQEYYWQMDKTAVALIDNKTITALNAAGVLNKALQIACGYVYNRDGKVIKLDNTPRLQLTIDLIDSCSEKVLLFAPFKSAINGLHETLDLNDIPHLIVHGDVLASKRGEIFRTFQTKPDHKVLLAHPGTMSHGVHLPAASMVIWFGPITSLNMFYQANGRIYRVGQMNKTLIAMIGGSERERKLYKLLANNENVQNKILELLETVG